MYRCIARIVAYVLVSGYHMVPREMWYGVLGFGCDGKQRLAHAPIALTDDQGMATALDTDAAPLSAFARMAYCGHDRRGAAQAIRKGRQ
jgi:hypothetical protein